MADEIVKNLFLGDWGDAMKWHDRLVTSVPLFGGPIDKVIDVLDAVELDPQGFVSIPVLDAYATLIDAYLAAGCKVLVHCKAGMERSPLVIAWYLHIYKGMSMDSAYNLLKEKRSIVTRRLAWLPKGF